MLDLFIFLLPGSGTNEIQGFDEPWRRDGAEETINARELLLAGIIVGPRLVASTAIFLFIGDNIKKKDIAIMILLQQSKDNGRQIRLLFIAVLPLLNLFVFETTNITQYFSSLSTTR